MRSTISAPATSQSVKVFAVVAYLFNGIKVMINI